MPNPSTTDQPKPHTNAYYRRLLQQAIATVPATPVHERTDIGEHYEIMTTIVYNLVVAEGDEVWLTVAPAVDCTLALPAKESASEGW